MKPRRRRVRTAPGSSSGAPSLIRAKGSEGLSTPPPERPSCGPDSVVADSRTLFLRASNSVRAADLVAAAVARVGTSQPQARRHRRNDRSAMGLALGTGPVTALMGDLSFFHDAGALAVPAVSRRPISSSSSPWRGGGIFRGLEHGPRERPDLHALVRHPSAHLDRRELARAHGLNRYRGGVDAGGTARPRRRAPRGVVVCRIVCSPPTSSGREEGGTGLAFTANVQIRFSNREDKACTWSHQPRSDAWKEGVYERHATGSLRGQRPGAPQDHDTRKPRRVRGIHADPPLNDQPENRFPSAPVPASRRPLQEADGADEPHPDEARQNALVRNQRDSGNCGARRGTRRHDAQAFRGAQACDA